MNIKILESAKTDLKEGFWFYDKQNKGIGMYFLDSLYADIDSLRIYGGIHSIHFNHYYRMLSKRFPFAIYYKKCQNTFAVHAVIDCRKNPAWLKQRLI